jgi:hypothetical protein
MLKFSKKMVIKISGGVLKRSWWQVWTYRSISLKADAVLCTVTFN